MLKLNASYSKKVPADTEYSSQSFHASVEVELPDGLTPEQLNAKIHETFALVRDSVEAELKVNPINQPVLLPSEPSSNASPGSFAQPRQNRQAYNKKSVQDAPASPKQIKYLMDIARQIGFTPDQLKAKFNVSSLESLTKLQCSRAIDELNGKAA